MFLRIIILLALAAFSLSEVDRPNFGGANMYFIYAVEDQYRISLLDSMQKADMRLLRIFILDYGNNTGIADVESPVGIWHDEILEKVDKLMLECYERDIKLTIALHDRWSLGCWRADSYVDKYNIKTTPDCSKLAVLNDPREFYNNASAIQDFKNRIAHVLNHKNPFFNNVAWKDLSQVIFSIQPENEPRYRANPSWLGEMISFIKDMAPNILTTSGGPAGGLERPDPLSLVDIEDLDVLTLHSYDSISDFQKLISKFQKAVATKGKRFFVEEIGTGPGPQRLPFYKAWLEAIDQRVPFQYWMLGTRTSLDSWEVGPGEPAWDDSIAPTAINASQSLGLYLWPEIFD